MRHTLLTLLLLLAALTGRSQTAADSLATLVSDCRSTFFKGFGTDNAAVTASLPLFERYARALLDPATQAEAERVADAWLMLRWYTLALRQVDSPAMTDALGLFRRYYKQKGRTAFEGYFSAVDPSHAYYTSHGNAAMVDSIASELYGEAVATGTTGMFLPAAMYMKVYPEFVRGNTGQAASWLQQMRTAAHPHLDGARHGYLYTTYYLPGLTDLAQYYFLSGHYEQALDVASELEAAWKDETGEKSQQYLSVLASEIDLFYRLARMTDMKRTFEKLDSLTALPDLQADPNFLAQLRQGLDGYRSLFSSEQTTAQTSSQSASQPIASDANKLLAEIARLFQQREVTEAIAKCDEWLTLVGQQPLLDLFSFNQTITALSTKLLKENMADEALRLLVRAKTLIVEKFGAGKGAERGVEMCLAYCYVTMGDMTQQLRHLLIAKQQFDLAGDHGQQYYGCVEQLISASLNNEDYAYAKLYLDELTPLVDEQLSVAGADADNKRKPFGGYMAFYNFRLGYMDKAVAQVERLLADNADVPDELRRLWGSILIADGQTERAETLLQDIVTRKNVLENDKLQALWALNLCKAANRSADAATWLSREHETLRTDWLALAASQSAFDKELYWQARVERLSMTNNFALYRLHDAPEVRQRAYDNALYVKSHTRSQVDDDCGWTAVRQQLGAKDVAIEFVAMPTSPLDNTEGRYGALVLRSTSESPEFVDLCPISAVDGLLFSAVHTDTALVNSLYAPTDTRLYDLVWAKLEPYVHEGDTVFFSPVDVLSHISHDAVGDGRCRLADRFSLQQVSSTARIAEVRHGRPGGGRAVVYGGISYELDDDEMVAAARSYRHDDGQLLAMRSVYAPAATRGAVDELEGTRIEAETIGRVLADHHYDVTLRMGAEANEESVKSLGGRAPAILHIGTHGFILSSYSDQDSHLSLLGKDGLMDKKQQSALLYTGLLFAGANRAWRGEPVPDGVDDGILSAYELSQIDLTGCGLVVLSACETGLGMTQSRYQDSFGLRYALKYAGVQTIIASLWQVPDEATSLLMSTLYAHIAEGSTPRAALKAAQQAVRQQFPEPYFWAAFYVVD